jgi:hypothetical protein
MICPRRPQILIGAALFIFAPFVLPPISPMPLIMPPVMQIDRVIPCTPAYAFKPRKNANPDIEAVIIVPKIVVPVSGSGKKGKIEVSKVNNNA